MRSFILVCVANMFFIGSATSGTFLAANDAAAEYIEKQIRASQFLSYATFGPTMTEIDALARRMSAIGVQPACEEWIDSQFSIPATEHHALTKEMIAADGGPPATSDGFWKGYRNYAWWDAALSAPDQLRQRVAWALSQIWVTSESIDDFRKDYKDLSGNLASLGLADYYDKMVENSFGNYRNLMADVTSHPVMGVYLSSHRNEKPDPSNNRYPDENYAREILQLFTIGLYELTLNGEWKLGSDGQPIPTYDNETIKNFARVFTGFDYGRSACFNCPVFRKAANNALLESGDYHTPMKMYEEKHDQHSKTLLNGRVLGAGQKGMDDINQALDNIFKHQNVGPFVARLLIQRMVRSNPSRAYIRRVAQAFSANDQNVRGDLKAVIKAILLDPELLTGVTIIREPGVVSARPTGPNFARLQEPVVRYAAMIRAFSPETLYHTGRFMVSSLSLDANQEPYTSPSVFNFYLPDYAPNELAELTNPSAPGPVTAPEFQILTDVTANRFNNLLRSNVMAGKISKRLNAGNHKNISTILLNFNTERSLADSPTDLLSRLDLLLCRGAMTVETRSILRQAIFPATNHVQDANLRSDLRAKEAILGTLISPDCAITY
jgi:uncharacterized protein (DUF1800 family)